MSDKTPHEGGRSGSGADEKKRRRKKRGGRGGGGRHGGGGGGGGGGRGGDRTSGGRDKQSTDNGGDGKGEVGKNRNRNRNRNKNRNRNRGRDKGSKRVVLSCLPPAMGTFLMRAAEALDFTLWPSLGGTQVLGSGRLLVPLTAPENRCLRVFVSFLEDRKVRLYPATSQQRVFLRAIGGGVVNGDNGEAGAGAGKQEASGAAAVAAAAAAAAAEVGGATGAEATADSGDNELNEWVAAFRRYLGDLGCPHKIEGRSLLPYPGLVWLVSHAVSLEYEDGASAFNSDAAVTTARAEVSSAEEATDGGEEDRAQLEALLSSIRLGYTVPLRGGKDGGRSGSGGSDGDDAMAAGALERAVRVLTLLQLSRLRASQDACNRVIATAQEFTADPRTDATLGRVGR